MFSTIGTDLTYPSMASPLSTAQVGTGSVFGSVAVSNFPLKLI